MDDSVGFRCKSTHAPKQDVINYISTNHSQVNQSESGIEGFSLLLEILGASEFSAPTNHILKGLCILLELKIGSRNTIRQRKKQQIQEFALGQKAQSRFQVTQK